MNEFLILEQQHMSFCDIKILFIKVTNLTYIKIYIRLYQKKIIKELYYLQNLTRKQKSILLQKVYYKELIFFAYYF